MSAAPILDDTWPSRLGGYDIVRPLSLGGMGAVLLAERRAHGFTKEVAIKVVLPQLVKDEATHRLFVDEARLAARFVHPNLVPVHDFGDEAGVFYMVMEYVEGRSVLDLLRHHAAPVAPTLAARIIADAGRGLAWAHQLCDDDGRPLGVVHRDVSPDNLLLGRVGAVKVLDFGIAKSRLRGQHTAVGGLRGKPPYLAPERLRGDAVDERADCWSLGVVLHELLSGDRLFVGEGVGLYDAIFSGPIRPLPANTPPALRVLVDGALTRHLSRRLSTAELVTGLDAYLRTEERLLTPQVLLEELHRAVPGFLSGHGPAAGAVSVVGRPDGVSTAALDGPPPDAPPLPTLAHHGEQPTTRVDRPAFRAGGRPPDTEAVAVANDVANVANDDATTPIEIRDSQRRWGPLLGVVGLGLVGVVAAGLWAAEPGPVNVLRTAPSPSNSTSTSPTPTPTPTPTPPSGNTPPAMTEKGAKGEPGAPGRVDDDGVDAEPRPASADGGKAADDVDVELDADSAAVVDVAEVPAPAPAPEPRPRVRSRRRGRTAATTSQAPPAGTGIVVPDRTPYVEVLVDGVKVGVSPLGTARRPYAIPVGAHTVVLVEPATGQTVARKRITIRAGQGTVVRP